MPNPKSLREEIETALSALVGKELWDGTRALNMEMFDIGRRIEVQNMRNETVEVGEYRLHIQAPWRIVSEQGILVGSVDRHYPTTDQENEEFDPDRDRSLCEEKLRAWLDVRRSRPVIIEHVGADEMGGFRLGLSGDSALEVFSASSRSDYEHWRLIGPGSSSPPHFVIEGRRVENG